MNIVDAIKSKFHKFRREKNDKTRLCKICKKRIEKDEECIGIEKFEVGYNKIFFHIDCFKLNIRYLNLFDEEENKNE